VKTAEPLALAIPANKVFCLSSMVDANLALTDRDLCTTFGQYADSSFERFTHPDGTVYIIIGNGYYQYPVRVGTTSTYTYAERYATGNPNNIPLFK
jgi:hypothetical protein